MKHILNMFLKSVTRTDLDPPPQCKKCYTFFFFLMKASLRLDCWKFLDILIWPREWHHLTWIMDGLKEFGRGCNEFGCKQAQMHWALNTALIDRCRGYLWCQCVRPWTWSSHRYSTTRGQNSPAEGNDNWLKNRFFWAANKRKKDKICQFKLLAELNPNFSFFIYFLLKTPIFL